MLRKIRTGLSFTLLALLLTACGGGGSTAGPPGAGGGSGSNGSSGTPPNQTPQYTIGGVVNGLAGSGLVLQLNASGDLGISANGAFTFPAQMSSGSSFAITIKTQPTHPMQSCAVVAGTGTIATANVVSPQINCTTLYGIGGTVVGLTGNGLALRLNGEAELAISANGSFTFPTHLPNGSAYSVVASAQPSAPSQSCTVTSGAGTLQGADVDGIQIACVDMYRVGGSVTGMLSPGLVLGLDSANLPVGADGSFSFPDALAAGTSYQVTVRSSPAGQSCSITNASGVVSSSSVSSIKVSCSFPASLAYATKQIRLSWGAVNGALGYRVLAAPGSSATFSQIQSLPAGTTQAIVDLDIDDFESPHSLYRVEACTPVGCLTSSDLATTAAGILQSIGYFKASNAGFDDTFSAVALSGNGQTLAVGAPGEWSDADGVNGNQNDDSARGAGAVYVFRNHGPDGWVQEAYIKAAHSSANDGFGNSLALSSDGDTLAIGAWHDSGFALDGAGNPTSTGGLLSGATYVFTRTAGTWTQQAYLKASNAEYADQFGTAVTLSADGNLLVVGAPQESSSSTGIDGNQSDNSLQWAGAAYVFHRFAGAWTQEAYVKPAVLDGGIEFGGAVALSGDGTTFAVGAIIESSAATGINGNPYAPIEQLSGAVYVFNRSGTTWSQQAYVKASDTTQRDFFGTSVALSHDGNTLAVGAPGEDAVLGGDPVNLEGTVYVFARVASNWSQTQKLKGLDPGDGDAFGTAVALDAAGTSLLVGAPGEESNQAGVGGQPTNNLAMGAGAAFLFRLENGLWGNPVYIKAPNPEGPSASDGLIRGDRFGATLAVSADGRTYAVSSPREDGPAEQTAYDSGAVYLY